MPEVKQNDLGGLLKGSDVEKAGRKTIGGIVLGVRAGVKGVNSPYVIDFDTDILPGISSWPCNKTEANVLAGKISNLTENWVGWGIVLSVKPKNNPQMALRNGVAEYLVPGLVVMAVMKPADAAKKRTTKATYKADKVAAASAPERPIDWDNPPF